MTYKHVRTTHTYITSVIEIQTVDLFLFTSDQINRRYRTGTSLLTVGD